MGHKQVPIEDPLATDQNTRSVAEGFAVGGIVAAVLGLVAVWIARLVRHRD